MVDGRIATLVLTQLAPAALIGVTIWRFASNPVALIGLIGVMVIGGLYLLSYTDSF